MKNLLFISVLTGVSLFPFSSCKDTPLFFQIVVVNNTTDHLYIYEKEGNGNYHKIGEVDSGGGSYKFKGFVIETDYILQARKDVGTVVASKEVNQKEDDDILWEI